MLVHVRANSILREWTVSNSQSVLISFVTAEENRISEIKQGKVGLPELKIQ
jgi:hypothetical protein